MSKKSKYWWMGYKKQRLLKGWMVSADDNINIGYMHILLFKQLNHQMIQSNSIKQLSLPKESLHLENEFTNMRAPHDHLQNNGNTEGNKNATDNNKSQGVGIQKLRKGIQEIAQIDFMSGFEDFLTTFNLLSDENNPKIAGDKLGDPQMINNSSVGIEPSIDTFNNTPYFGNEASLNLRQDKINIKKIALQDGFAGVAETIAQKSEEAVKEFIQLFDRKLFTFQTLFQKIQSKIQESESELALNFNQFPIDEEKVKEGHFRKKTNYSLQSQNEFIRESFASHQNLEQVKKYVEQLKNQSASKHFKFNSQKLDQFSRIVLQVSNNYLERVAISEIFSYKNSLIEETNNNKKQGERSSSAIVSQRMSSAHSQRLVSAISKNSQNEDTFNMDMTMKTKISKNTNNFGKMDSLMYSADSGFGIFSQQNENNRNAMSQSRTPINKIDEIEEIEKEENLKNEKKGLYKNYSERKEQKLENKGRRLNSSKQKIEEEIGSGEDEKKLALQENRKSLDKSSNPIGQKTRNKENSYGKKQKSKGALHKKSQEHESSDREDSIINKVENFDADDQEDNQQKKLSESVNFGRIKLSNAKAKKRVETESNNNIGGKVGEDYKKNKRFNKVDFSKYEGKEQLISHEGSRLSLHKSKLSPNKSNVNSQSSIFSTEINNYSNKIEKLKEQKVLKKKELLKQLAKVNYEIKVLHEKEDSLNPQILGNNHFVSRVKISDNSEAQKKAERLVKNLRSQKQSRNLAKIGEFAHVDRNINDYMEELIKLREENEEKAKNKKKLEILQRMKLNQMRKLKEKKKIQQSQQFVLNLKGDGSFQKNLKADRQDQISKRSPTKQQQEHQNVPIVNLKNNITPELSSKKAYLNKLRSFTVKKEEVSPYDQLLG